MQADLHPRCKADLHPRLQSPIPSGSRARGDWQAACVPSGELPRVRPGGEGVALRYYVRQHRKHVSGPYALKDLKDWVGEGHIREDMEFSTDGEEWMLGFEMIELFGDRRARAEPRPRRRPRRRLWGRRA